MSDNITIPECVIDALEEVRASGKTNMLDRNAVMFYVDKNSRCEAFVWLHDNKTRYMDALREVGWRRQP